ncbi:MAG: HypC/HybG/HupF family hydrogenase formation chaperone [archaeon]
MMCLAIPGKITKIVGDSATVDYGGEQREAKLINQDIKVGDYVVVQNKLILLKLPEEQALESIELWKKALQNED